MEDADSGQLKAKKKKTEKGNEKRWWYVELFFLFYFVCVCHLYHCQTTQLLRSCEIVSLRLTGLHFCRFHDRLTQNYELKSGGKISLDEILEKAKDFHFTLKGKEVCTIV